MKTKTKSELEKELVKLQQRIIELEKSETQCKLAELENILNTSPIHIASIDINGKYTSWNKASEDMFGITAEEVIGKLTPRRFHRNDKEAKTVIETVERAGKYDDEIILIRRDGSEFPAHLLVSKTIDSSGNHIGYTGVAVDISERKQAEKVLAESELQFRSLSDASMEGIGIIQDGKVLIANRKASEIFGYDHFEIIGKTLLEFVAKESRELALKNFRDKFREPFEIVAIRKDGSKFLAEVCGKSIEFKGHSGRVIAIRDITEQKQAEETQLVLYNIANAVNTTKNLHSLFVSIKEYLNKIIDTTNFYVAIIDEKTNIISLPYVVDEKDNFTSFPAGKTITAHVINTGKPLLATEKVLKKLIHSGEVIIHGTTPKVWLGVPLKIEDKVTGVVAVHSYTNKSLYTEKDIEIFEFVADEIALSIIHKQAEKALQESEKQLQTLIDNMPDFVCLKDRDSRWLLANEASIRIFQLEGIDYLGKKDSELAELNSKLRGSFLTCKESDARVWKEGALIHGEEMIPDADGSVRVYDVTKVPVSYSDGERKGLIIIGHDITESKQAEESIRKSEEKYRLLADNSMDAIWQMDLKLVFTYISPSIKDMMGYTVDEWVGSRLSQHSSIKEFFNIARKALSAIKYYKKFKHLTFDAVMLRKDGSEIPVEITSQLLFNKRGLPIGLQGATRDITERKQVGKELEDLYEKSEKSRKSLLSILEDVTKKEAALQESQERFQDIVTNSGDWIWEIDKEGRYTYCSPVVKQVLGYIPDEVLGKHFYDFFHPDERDELKKAAFKVFKKKGKFNNLINHNVHKDGHVILLETNAVPLLDDKGNLLGYRGVDRDITERIQAEEQIKKELKEKTVLLSEVHHRVKNNLQVISGLLQLQENEITTKEDALKGFAASQDRILAMAKAYELLLGSEYMSEVSVGKYIESLAGQLKRNYDIHHKVNISYSLEEFTISIEILDRLGLILNELITNSVKYAFEGRDSGNIRIELKETEKNIVIKISDDGIGMPEEIDMNSPETLGLSLVEMLMLQLRGTLSLDRKNGTIFTLEIPKKIVE